jgi:hypothetical protein
MTATEMTERWASVPPITAAEAWRRWEETEKAIEAMDLLVMAKIFRPICELIAPDPWAPKPMEPGL